MIKKLCGNPTGRARSTFPLYELHSTPFGRVPIHPRASPWNSALRVIRIFSLPFGLFCLHLVLSALDVYKRYHLPDIPMHILGGVFITNSFSLTITYFQERKILSEPNVFSRSVFLFGLISSSVVIWEFGEFTLDFFFDTVAQLSMEDTMLDMFLGLAGGTAFIVFLARASIKEYVKKDKTPQ